MRVIRSKRTPVFRTRREIERYFVGDTIECLICGRHFKRLHSHLAAKHGMAVDESKRRFGLPWTRGLTSATSLANSGWTDERKAKAREVAEKSQFFKFAHLTARRELAPFLKVEAIEHLGVNAKAVGKKFDERVRALAAKGLSIRAIARVLNVAHTTVLERTTRRRKGKPGLLDRIRDRYMAPFIIAAAGLLIAQSGSGLAQMTAVEQALADQINCDEWKKNQNGSWISKPDTKIGSYSFSNTTVAPGGWWLDGADVGTVLNKKCAK